MRSRALALVFALLAAGCATAGESPSEDATVGVESPRTSPTDGVPGGDKGRGKAGDQPGAAGKKEGGSKPGAPKASGDAPSGGGTQGGNSADGEDGGKGPETHDDTGAGGSGPGPRSPSGNDSEGALAPAAGTYVYSQKGFEEFCGAGCERNKLPRRQKIVTTVPQSSSSAATVITEARASRGRLTRTTTRYTRAGAFITEVYVRFTYAGYEFDQTYRPDPPAESLRLPLRVGQSWSGSWKGKVSGSYSVSVRDREQVTVDGRAVEAFELDTSTRFRGDFDGSAHATLWVDPRTKAILRTAGNLHVKSAYGSYTTGFATTLLSGPGY